MTTTELRDQNLNNLSLKNETIQVVIEKPLEESIKIETIPIIHKTDNIVLDYIVQINDDAANYPNTIKNFFLPKFKSNYIRTTKYTWWSFIPVNLFEQLRRLSNIYFILVMIFALIPGVSPIFPITSIFPVCFILGITALKDAIEDLIRLWTDIKVNGAKFEIVRNGRIEETTSAKLKVGDIIKVCDDEMFPCDLLFLSSNENGIGFVSTVNLNGESNLKLHNAKEETRSFDTPEKLSTLKGSVICEKPRFELEIFNSKLKIEGKEESIVTTKNLLLRGAILKNTSYIYGLVLYTGPQTKLSLNVKKPKFKLSLLDQKLNKFMIFILLLHLVIDISMVIAYVVYQYQYINGAFYLMGFNAGVNFTFVLLAFFSIFILNNLLIPASLFVSLEFIKTFQAKFMNWDLEMSYIHLDGTLKRMYPNTSNLNEDLSQIEFILSDKTGTLTENIMYFNKCSIGEGYIHNDRSNNGELLKLLKEKQVENNGNKYDLNFYAKQFLYAMVLCSTINPEIHPKTGELFYDGSSIDEIALVNGALRNGFKLVKRTQNQVEVEILGEIQKYEILRIIEFNSDRKRMTVIVKDEKGKITSFTKGADNVIIKRLHEKDPLILQKTIENCNIFASEGLRTLFFSYKYLEEKEYQDWENKYKEAELSTSMKLQKIQDLEDEMENNLSLIGASAIEDCLQDEVPETIDFFRKAGVQVWILTGDKRDTAVSIGKSSKLLSPNTYQAHICGETVEKVREELLECIERAKKPESDVALILDTDTLKIAHDNLMPQLIESIKFIKCAICCRVTPIQKALVVALIQKKFKKVALAIGDGANDVAMIGEAKVGVGIMGREGSQAARTADYAIPRFKHLKRLLATHGRYSLVRNSFFIQYSFYKNMNLTFIQAYFNFFCLFTSTSAFDSWYVTFYNILFTSLHPIFVGIFERDYPDKILEQSPEMYREIRQGIGYGMNWKTFAEWVTQSIIHSSIIFFSTVLICNYDTIIENTIDDIWVNSFFLGCAISTLNIIKGFLEMKYFNFLVLLSYFIGAFIFVAFDCFYSAFPIFFLDGHSGYFFLVYYVLTKVKFWIYVVLVVSTCVMIDLTYQLITRYFWKSQMEIQYEKAKENIKK